MGGWCERKGWGVDGEMGVRFFGNLKRLLWVCFEEDEKGRRLKRKKEKYGKEK